MKKAFALVVLIVTPMMAFAQGTVGFVNNSACLVREWTSPSDPTVISVPVGGGQVELFAAPNGTPLSSPLFWFSYFPRFTSMAGFLAANPGWSDIATTGIQPVAGRFNGGSFALPGVAGGANAEYFIIGWTGTATTFDAAVQTRGTWFGSSPLLTTSTGNPNTTPPGTAVLLSATFTGFTIPKTPEPTTFALAGLGVVMLMIFRRRR